MKHSHTFKVLFSFIAIAILMGFATQNAAIAQTTAVDLNPKISSRLLAQKVNAFVVIVDESLTMNDVYKNSSKLNQEKALISLFNDTIPNISLNAAARAFGRFSMFGDDTSKTLFGMSSYSKSALPQAVEPFQTGRGLSPLNIALDAASADLQSQPGQMAVIVFSDGEDMDGFAPVAAAQRLKSAYGDRVCIYTVQLGNHEGGKKIMQQVADAGQCGFMVTGDSISSADGMAEFVEKVFLKSYVAESRPVVKEEPRPVKEEVVIEEKPQAAAAPVMIELNILFATGKSNIMPKYRNEIKKVADYMMQYPDSKVTIEGYTDNVGKPAANKKLSQNRANSVKNYLIKNFKVNNARVSAIGYGQEKPIADNTTKEGRAKNRRVIGVFN